MGGEKSQHGDVIDSVDYLHAAHKKKRNGQSILHLQPPPPHPQPPLIATSSSLISIYRHCVPHLQALGRRMCTIKSSGGLGVREGGCGEDTSSVLPLQRPSQAQEQVRLQANSKNLPPAAAEGGKGSHGPIKWLCRLIEK